MYSLVGPHSAPAALCLSRADAGSRKYDPFYDAGKSVLATLEENIRAVPDISPDGSQDPSTSQCSVLHPPCRRDTDDASFVMHDSTTLKDSFRKKKLCLKSTASHCGASRRERVLQLEGRTIMPSQPSRTRNLVAPRAVFKTSLNHGAMTKRRDRRQTPVSSRAKLKSRTSWTQQRHLEYLAISLRTLAKRLGLAQQSKQ